MLQEQQQQLQGLLGALQDTLKTVTTKLDDSAAATRKAMADQTLATTNIGDNVRVLREKTDETNVRISTMSQELEALRQTIASQPAPQPVAAPPPARIRPGAVDGADAAAATRHRRPRPGRHRSGCTRPATTTTWPADDPMAIQGFQAFIQVFPKAPQAGGAIYNIGMSYYNLEQVARGARRVPEGDQRLPAGAGQHRGRTRTTSSARPTSA